MQKLIYFIKADAHEETLLHKQNWVQDAKKCFWKVFCFQDADFVSQHMLRGVANEEAFEKH